MEIKITGSAKEIAEFIRQLQALQLEECHKITVEDVAVKDYQIVGAAKHTTKEYEQKETEEKDYYRKIENLIRDANDSKMISCLRHAMTTAAWYRALGRISEDQYVQLCKRIDWPAGTHVEQK